MSYYGFEYFCGANVVVKVNGVPVLEAAGLSYNASDSKMPIYGYSSRHYDAVAQGQVLVRGRLLVNYVHQDYLFRVIESGQEILIPPSQAPISKTPSINEESLKHLLKDDAEAAAFISKMKAKYFTAEESTKPTARYNPFDISGGVDIMVVFGEQDDESKPLGKTAVLLVDVHFVGRATSLEISEEAIVESYDFFARDVISLNN